MISFRKLATNYSLLAAGEILSKAFTFVAFMYLARTLGPDYYGHLEFTIAVLVFFTLFVDLGTSPWGAREIAREPDKLPETLSGIFFSRLMMAILALALVFAFAQIFTQGILRKLLLIYSLSLLTIPLLLQWVFQGFQEMKTVAWTSITRQFTFSLLVFGFVHSKEDLLKIGWIECISSLAIMSCIFLVFRKRVGKFQPDWNPFAVKTAIRQSYPIGLSELSWAMIWYSATVMLGLLVGGNAVGFFAASHRPVMAIHTFVWLHFYNLLPSIAQSMQQPGTEALRSLLHRALKLASWGAFLLGSMGLILARPLILFIFGPQYESGIVTFQILIWVLAALMISGHFSYALIGWNLQKFHMLSFLIATIVTIGLGLLLIPRFEVTGAAISVFGGILTKGILAWAFVNHKIARIPVMPHVWKPAIPAAISLLANFFLIHGEPYVAGIFTVVIFSAAIFIFEPGIFTRLRSAWKE